MPADTLQNMALHALSLRGREIRDFGECPVHLLKSFITKIVNPDQLRILEQRSPQIVGHTRDVWISMLKRDIPFWKQRLPEDYETSIFALENAARWNRAYFKLKKDVQVEKEKSRNTLVQELQQSAIARGPETQVRKKEPLYLSGGPARQRKSYNDAKYAMNKDMYSKSKGESFFDKVKRNAVTKAVSKRRGADSGLKPAMARAVKKAPWQMVEDIEKAKETITRNIGLPTDDPFTKRPSPPVHTKQDDVDSRAAKAQGITKLTVDFLEDDDEDMDMADHDSDDELFGVKPKTRMPASPPVRYNPSLKRLSPPLKKPSRPVRAASPPKRPVPSANIASAPKRVSPPIRTASPSISHQGAVSKGSAPSQGLKVVKRNKPARSIFAKK